MIISLNTLKSSAITEHDTPVTMTNSRFYHDSARDEIVEIGLKPKTKKPYRRAICKEFDIYSIHFYCYDAIPAFVTINYGSDGHVFTEMIVGEKFLRSDYTGYFDGVKRFPKCSDSIFNDLVNEKINNAPKTEIKLPYRQWLYLAKHAYKLTDIEKLFNKH